MKITVIKKSDSKVKTMSVCPFVIDYPPEAGKQS
jgi:hypothetical protein